MNPARFSQRKSSRVRLTVAVALGSNLGDRAAHLDWAVARLRGLLTDLAVSSYINTAPVGVSDQPDFLNAVVIGHTDLPPRALLDALLTLEAERGRVRTGSVDPRPLDLDLILYGDSIIDEPGLVVPHPRFRERAFVLGPLVEIAPGAVDPVTGQRADSLLAALQ